MSIKKNEDGRIEVYPSIGGLATGLASYTKDPQTKWIGWPGMPSDELSGSDKKTISAKLKKYNCYPVFLSKQQIDDFYNGYCNAILWPIFHNLTPERTKTEWWSAYEEVNQIFAGAVQHYAPKSKTIWVHDYQLMLLPRLLRRIFATSKIGFFLHIPFPSFEHFRKLDEEKDLVRGLIGSDLIGFHTRSYGKNFLESVDILNIGKVQENSIINGRRTTLVSDFPMGIDYKRFTDLSKSTQVQKNVIKLKNKYGNRKIIFTNDRLDPSKGLPHKIKAYRKLLDIKPELRGEVVMAMLVAPSRVEVKAYKKLKEELEELVADVNKTYGTKKWQPIDFMFRTMDFNEITPYYQAADVAFVTPVRDGMNLVAKEYIASQPDRKGVLILSETAGAAEELEHALLVNPRHHNSMVKTLYQGLMMPDIELKNRIYTMQRHLSRNNVQGWAKKFIGGLNQLQKSKLAMTPNLNETITKKLVQDYQQATKRLLVFDYDGVLSPHVDQPKDAKPTPELKKLLKKLTKDDLNKVVIVSGRSHEDLEKWLGDIDLDMFAEHGAFSRSGGVWRESAILSRAWKPKVIKQMQVFAKRTKGSFVEEKTNSIVWHYRQSQKALGQANALLLRQQLKADLIGTNLGVYSGHMIVEVKSKNINKGTALGGHFRVKPDFVLIAGDDYTDEDMFKAAPLGSYTLKVGEGLTRAHYRVRDSKAIIDLIKKLSA